MIENMECSLDDEWDNFMISNDIDSFQNNDNTHEIVSSSIVNESCPNPSDIYISTKTNISYLNSNVDLRDVFWKIPIIKYTNPIEGIVKKQMKFNTSTVEDFNSIQDKLQTETCVEENVITSINNPHGRIKFKDIRKISIGICKKDVVSYRSKKKSAFYNCFVIILRIKYKNVFKEFHVKIFNTGKMEIPGIQTDEAYNLVLDKTVSILSSCMKTDSLRVEREKTETVLINSNFNCGFYINRESLFDILKNKYSIECIFDPCSYPGIQCKFYYDSSQTLQDGIKKNADTKYTHVSFMIFRTGSVLIVGKCGEDILQYIYTFLTSMLRKEFLNIGVRIITKSDVDQKKAKLPKTRKKILILH